MQLLVSVRSSDEAVAALAGGADIIDAKEPLAGPLGPVEIDTLAAISRVVAGTREVTAALGDHAEVDVVRSEAALYAAAGARFVKVGIRETVCQREAVRLLGAAQDGASATAGGVIAVAYADAASVGALSADIVLEAAVVAGVAGVLLDTADKNGPGLCQILTPIALTDWVCRVRQAGLLAAVAGKLRAEDIIHARASGADVVGVRGAACLRDRTSTVSVEKVQQLRDLCCDRSSRVA